MSSSWLLHFACAVGLVCAIESAAHFFASLVVLP